MKIFDISKLPYEKIGKQIKHVLFVGNRDFAAYDCFCNLAAKCKINGSDIQNHYMDDCNFKTILNNINMPSMLMPYRAHHIKMVTKDLKNILKEAKVKNDSFIIYDLIDISIQNTIIKNFANNPEFCFVYCYKTSLGLSVLDGISDFKIKKRITDFCNEIEESSEKFMTKVNLKSDNNDITEKIVDDVIQSYGFDENKLPQIVLDQIYDDNKVACNKLLFNNFFANLFEPDYWNKYFDIKNSSVYSRNMIVKIAKAFIDIEKIIMKNAFIYPEIPLISRLLFLMYDAKKI